MRHLHRLDANQAEIVQALEKAGCSCLSLAPLGHGAPDLLVARGGKMWILELKTETGSLLEDQIEWHKFWNAPVYLVRTITEALKAVGLSRPKEAITINERL